MRQANRTDEQLRPIHIQTGVQKDPAGSVQIAFGQTVVLCSAMVAEEVPDWIRRQKLDHGWITAEYSMLPGATPERGSRKPKGRSEEIQRLIGRGLRAGVDLKKLGNRSIYVDCDVIQADGGTRTASITGGYVALALAIRRLMEKRLLLEDPILRPVCAVSTALVDGRVVVDPDYQEDRRAEVDMNFVITSGEQFIEVQGAAEGSPFGQPALQRMIAQALQAAEQLFAVQRQALSKA